MKCKSTRLIVVCVCLTLMVAGSAAQDAGKSTQDAGRSKDCLGNAANQLEMNQCAGADADAADRELNLTYQALLKQYADQAQFIERLREAQRAWLKYRDAQIEMKFPTSPGQTAATEYGSVYPMCFARYKAELIKRRTQELRAWLAGAHEGDVCVGSIKTRQGPQ